MSSDDINNAKEHEGLKFSIKAMHIHMSANADLQARILKDIEKTATDTLEQAKKNKWQGYCSGRRYNNIRGGGCCDYIFKEKKMAYDIIVIWIS